MRVVTEVRVARPVPLPTTHVARLKKSLKTGRQNQLKTSRRKSVTPEATRRWTQHLNTDVIETGARRRFTLFRTAQATPVPNFANRGERRRHRSTAMVALQFAYFHKNITKSGPLMSELQISSPRVGRVPQTAYSFASLRWQASEEVELLATKTPSISIKDRRSSMDGEDQSRHRIDSTPSWNRSEAGHRPSFSGVGHRPEARVREILFLLLTSP